MNIETKSGQPKNFLGPYLVAVAIYEIIFLFTVLVPIPEGLNPIVVLIELIYFLLLLPLLFFSFVLIVKSFIQRDYLKKQYLVAPIYFFVAHLIIIPSIAMFALTLPESNTVLSSGVNPTTTGGSWWSENIVNNFVFLIHVLGLLLALYFLFRVYRVIIKKSPRIEILIEKK